MSAWRWLCAQPPARTAVLLAFGARSFLGWLAAVPLVRTVGESGVLSFEEGDRLLFQPGALWLAELLYAESGALWASAKAGLVLALLGLVLLSVPSALLYSVTLFPSLRLPRALGRAAAALPSFLVIGLVELFGLALVLGVSVSVALAISAPPSGSMSERARDLLSLAALAPGLLVAAAIAIVSDIARSAALERRGRLFQNIAQRLNRKVLLDLTAGFTLATGAGCLAVSVAARLTTLLRVEEPGAARVLAAVLLHQLVLLALVLLQLFWARRVVAARVRPDDDERAPPESADHTGVAGGPGEGSLTGQAAS